MADIYNNKKSIHQLNKFDEESKDRNDIYRCTKFLKCPADRIRTTHNGVEYPSQIFTSSLSDLKASSARKIIEA